MTSVLDYSTTAGSNTSIGGISIAENCPPANINNAIRTDMAEWAKWLHATTGEKISGGAADAQTLSTGLGWSALAPILLCFKAGLTNTGAAMTINVDALGARDVKMPDGTNPPAGAVTTDGIYLIAYETAGSTWRLLGGSGEALDANLEAIAALAVTDSNIIVGNGSTWVAESGATARTSLGAAAKGAWEEVNAQTGTSYTFALVDAGALVTMNNASANSAVIPLNSVVAFPLKTVISVQQIGAGVTTIDATGGVTLNGISGGNGALFYRYAGVTLTKIGTDTWLMAGAHQTVA